MTLNRNKSTALRLKFLMHVVRKECQHLISTDQRLFATPFSFERAKQVETDLELSGQVEAFVGRFNSPLRQDYSSP